MKKGTKRRTPKPRTIRIRDLADGLLDLAAKYIESKGGKAVVIGGIQVQRWPGERDGIYYLAIRFLGRPPVKGPPGGGS